MASVSSSTTRASAPGPFPGRWLHHAAGYLVAEVGSRGLTFAALIGIASFVGVEDFGFLSIALGLANIGSILVALGLPNTVIRYAYAGVPLARLLGTIASILGTTVVVGAVISLLAADELAAFLEIPADLIPPMIAAASGIAFRSVWVSSLRARHRTGTYVAAVVGEPAIAISIASWLLVTGQADAPRLVWAFAASSIVMALVGVFEWSRSTGLAWSTSLARELLAFSIPLIGHAVSMYAISTYDQVIINQTIGTTEAGRYALAYRWGMAMVAVTAAFSALWGPRFQELVRTEAGRARLDGLATRAMGGLAASCVVLMIVIPVAARIVTPASLDAAIGLTAFVTYAYLWFALYTITIGYGIYHRRTRRIALASATVMAVNVGLNYAIVPVLGIGAAVGTTILAYVMLFLVQWWLVRDVATDIRYGRLAVVVALLGVVPFLVRSVL